jgi:hypothetical protein
MLNGVECAFLIRRKPASVSTSRSLRGVLSIIVGIYLADYGFAFWPPLP